ncbi:MULTISPECIES: TetR/AcrR family transcriptional regulator [Streptomyces]|uniref:TetR/AcrR family transcriptional regulator n=1 Tax=Streptomyces TaxID=1883 RepID=UPI0004C681D6|nr:MULTISPECIES: TetR/AcrR family transcriptional regulator [Streptomyces]
MEAVHSDGRVERGNATRRLVLRRTMEVASVEGLGGLSIGRIAGELGLSKSGVFALFGSKEELQLATVRAARSVFVKAIVQPVLEMPEGVARVLRLCDGYLEYSRGRVFPGGCFFLAVATEFAAREGAVRDAVALARQEWDQLITDALTAARAAGELRADTDAAQLGFELVALLDMANTTSALLGDETGYERAAAAVRGRLRAAAVTGAGV